MGTPHFFWYPDADGPVASVDLGEELTDLTEERITVGEPMPVHVGGIVRTGAAWRVTVQLVDFGFGTGGTLADALEPLIAHLSAGGLCGFTRDESKVFAARLPRLPTRGTTTIRPLSNPFISWESSAALSGDDILVMEEPFPGHRRERVKVNGTPSSVTQIAVYGGQGYTSGLVQTYEERPVVRWADFWPVLCLDPDADPSQILTSSQRRAWSLDLPLIWSPALAAAMWRPRAGAFSDLSTGSDLRLRSSAQNMADTLESAVGARSVRRSTVFGGPRIHHRGWVS